MKPHEPVQHRTISYPTFLHHTHSFQELVFLPEVYPCSELYRLLARLRLVEIAAVMTIENRTVSITDLHRVIRGLRDHAGVLLFRSSRIYSGVRCDVLQGTRSSRYPS